MRHYRFTNGPVEVKVVAIIALAIVWLLITIFMNHPEAVEHWYSNGVYLVVCKTLHPVFNLVPFSVGDIFYIGAIIFLLFILYRLIRLTIQRLFRQLLIYSLKVIIGVQTLVIVFYLFWGLNYFRVPAAKRLNLQDTSYTFDDIKNVTLLLIDSANATRARLTQTDMQQSDNNIFNKAVIAVQNLAHTPGYPAIHPRIKRSTLTFFMNYMGTAGYFNPFTSEAQLDYQMPVFLKSFTACHEMAHQMGFGAEDEADFGGFAAGMCSGDKLLRYSTYYSSVGQFMSAVFRTDSMVFKHYKTLLSPQVRADFKTDRLYWKSFEGKAGILSAILYDNYLKSNNQPQGLKTYNQMVKLVMAWYFKKYNNRLPLRTTGSVTNAYPALHHNNPKG